MGKIKSIGIIAEDTSDFDASRILIKRIIKQNSVGFQKRVALGCGKLRRKVFDYAEDLKKRGCDLLIVIHDLDRNNMDALKKDLNLKLKGNSFLKYLICIPIEEIEAWFLSDPSGIKVALGLKRVPKIKGNPETISSPKEKLGNHVYFCSDKSKIYINTRHNEVIAGKVSINLIKEKCKSFLELHDFLSAQKY